MEKPQYIDWIVEETGIVIKDDIPLKCYKIDYKDDESILDDWALHIRRNYIEDTELKEDADDNAMTVEQYLHDYVIPQKGEELGATVRSADITEILISDLLEFVHQYSVPRYKLKNRSGKNNSQQGTDVIAYKYKNEDKTPNDKDELVAAEVKATLSNMEYTPIKNAIIDSRKDEHRLARSVNYCRKRLKELGKIEEAEEVKRFLFKPDNNSLIEEWIVQNELTEKIYTETELLYVITELYLQICGDFRYQEHIQSICKKWIDGQTPMEINNKETIGIAEVESLCNKRISYEMNFLIGNICDLIEVDGENEEQVDQRNILTLLQKKVKYGVPNMTAISICESVFNDRLLAIELAQILSDANIGTDKILNMLKAHSEEIFSCLDSYPEYFKDRLSVLMK